MDDPSASQPLLLLHPHANRSELLYSQLVQIRRFIKKLRIASFEANFDAVRAVLTPEQRNRVQQPMANMMGGYVTLLERLEVKDMIEKFGLFERKLLEDVFREITFAEKLITETFAGFFPMRLLGFDFDGIKTLNDEILGYDETDKVIAHGIDILHHTVRACRFDPEDKDRRVFPDFCCRTKSGDEGVVYLARARNREQCKVIAERYDDNLKNTPGVLVRTLQGETITVQPKVSHFIIEVHDPGKGMAIIDAAAETLKQTKKAKRAADEERKAA